MATSATTSCPKSIYIIGVPAAGKTTLVNALSQRLRTIKPQLKLYVIDEVAREIVMRERVKPEDIQAGKDHAMNLQRMILETQASREEQVIKNMDLVLSDRSGIDPIAFALQYGQPAVVQELLKSDAWDLLHPRMQSGLVILCEPQPQWFIEDGVRILPDSSTELFDLHTNFSELLTAQSIPFETLSASKIAVEDRVQTVMDLWERMATDSRRVTYSAAT